MSNHLPEPMTLARGGTLESMDRQVKRDEGILPYIVVFLLLSFIIGGLLILSNVRSDADRMFLGILGSGQHSWVLYDGSLYLDMIEQAQNSGVWLFENRFSPEMGTPRYLNSIWLVLGKLSAMVGLSPVGALTVFRFVVVLLFIIALRGAMREFVKNPAARSLVLFLIVFGGGLGWIFGIAGHLNSFFGLFFIEGKKSEIWCFLASMVTPHNLLAMSIVIWIMTGLSINSRGSRKALFVVPPLAFVLATFHPYDIPTIYAVGGMFLIMLGLRDGRINRPLLKTYLLIFILTSPVLAYHYWALNTAPDLQGLFLQNKIPPYGSIKYIIGLLPLGLLAFHRMIVGLADFRSVDNPRLLILSWLVILPALLYSYPEVGFAWKLTIAMPLPICVLAVEWIEHRAKRIQESSGSYNVPLWRASPVITSIIVVSLLSSAFIVLALVKKTRSRDEPFYLTRENYNALKWLAAQPGTNDTVLSAPLLGILMPGFTGKRSFIGHTTQSVDFQNRLKFTESLFLDGKLSDDELEFLQEHRIKWLIYSSREREWWPDIPPSRHLSLEYDRDGVRIYRIEYGSMTSRL